MYNIHPAETKYIIYILIHSILYIQYTVYIVYIYIYIYCNKYSIRITTSIYLNKIRLSI